MHVYTCYSPSHQEFFARFLQPSMPPGYELFTQQLDQKCPTGVFHSQDWGTSLADKARFILEAVRTERRLGEDRLFVFTDVDVIFVRDFASDLTARMADFDILNMDDFDHPCTGFMGLRANARTEAAWEWVADHTARIGCDQQAFIAFVNHLRVPPGWRSWWHRLRHPGWNPTRHQPAPRIGYLPGRHYSNFHHLDQGQHLYDASSPLRVGPDALADIFVFHANFTVGLDNKIDLLTQMQALQRDPATGSSA